MAHREGFIDEAWITQAELMDTSRMENESRNRSAVGQEDSRISHQDDAGHYQEDGCRKPGQWIVGQETRGQSCHG